MNTWNSASPTSSLVGLHYQYGSFRMRESWDFYKDDMSHKKPSAFFGPEGIHKKQKTAPRSCIVTSFSEDII